MRPRRGRRRQRCPGKWKGARRNRGTRRTRDGTRRKERDRIREGEEERTKGRSAGPQISPVIVSQSLAESRQTIHRRRAETSSLEGCSPLLNRRQSFFNPDERGKSWIARRQPACILSRAAGSVSFSTPVSHSYPRSCSHPHSSFDDEIAELADNTDWKKGSHTKSNFQLRATLVVRTPRYRLLWSSCIYNLLLWNPLRTP